MVNWLVRPGYTGEVEELSYTEGNEDGYAFIGCGEMGDFSDADTAEEIVSQLLRKRLGHPLIFSVWDGDQIYNFIDVIRLNDICVLPLKSPDGYVLGRFVGQYEYLPVDSENGRHGRAVKWVTGPIPRNEVPKNVQEYLDRQPFVVQIAEDAVDKWIGQKLQQYGAAMDEFGQPIDSESEKFDVLFRRRVEAAIDECDELGERDFLRKHDRGTPRDYWVRSSRSNRSQDKYRSKILAVMASTRNVTHGGWYHSDNACSVLHNAGYIIVNRKGAPVTEIETETGHYNIPDDINFLLQGKTRIRSVANNYYI